MVINQLFTSPGSPSSKYIPKLTHQPLWGFLYAPWTTEAPKVFGEKTGVNLREDELKKDLKGRGFSTRVILFMEEIPFPTTWDV